MTSGRVSLSARTVVIVDHLAGTHRLIPGGQDRVVVVRKVVVHRRPDQGPVGPHVGDVENERDSPVVGSGDDLGDPALASVGEEVEPGRRAQDPEAVDPGLELELDQAGQRLLIERAVGLQRSGQRRDDAVQSREVHDGSPWRKSSGR